MVSIIACMLMIALFGVTVCAALRHMPVWRTMDSSDSSLYRYALATCYAMTLCWSFSAVFFYISQGSNQPVHPQEFGAIVLFLWVITTILTMIEDAPREMTCTALYTVCTTLGGLAFMEGLKQRHDQVPHTTFGMLFCALGLVFLGYAIRHVQQQRRPKRVSVSKA